MTRIYYQMVDLLMEHCWRSMGGLNPYASPHAPVQHNEEVKMNIKLDEKACNTNQEGWKTQKTRKGKRNNNNKKHNVKKTDSSLNICSQLNNMI